MNPKKQSRRKAAAAKLEPIDWREFANDAVLNGNMSTLYRRPPSEDASTYASPEAMIEIEKRVSRSTPALGGLTDPAPPTVGLQHAVPSEPTDPEPTVGLPHSVGEVQPVSSAGPEPTDGSIPTVGPVPGLTTDGPRPAEGVEPTVGSAGELTNHGSGPRLKPTVGLTPTVGAPRNGPRDLSRSLHAEDIPRTSGAQPADSSNTEPPTATIPAVGITPTVGSVPAAGIKPTARLQPGKRVKPLRSIHDALTLAGQVLYRAMLGGNTEASGTACTKGYRQLAAETHLDKDTVRDLIVEFKHKGIVRETATYDPDTRLSKTYEVFPPDAVLHAWRQAGIHFVTAGRQRPLFCSSTGDPLPFEPTVGLQPSEGL